MIKLTYNSQSRIKTTEKQAAPSAQPETETLVETVLSASQVSLAAGASTPSGDGGPPPHQVIKLGIDVHLDRYVVVRQIDGGAPQPPQRFSPRQFLEWAKKQTALAQQVYSCYEAGPFGYRLHRKLKEWGIMGDLRDKRRPTAATACANTWSGWWPKPAWNGFAWKTTTTDRNCRTRKASCTAASSPASACR